MTLDVRVRQEPGHTDRHSGQGQVPDQANIAIDRLPAQQGCAAHGHLPQLTAVVQHNRQQRTHVYRNVKRQALIFPTEQQGREHQVCGARYRQKLREALHQGQHHRLYPVTHGRGPCSASFFQLISSRI